MKRLTAIATAIVFGTGAVSPVFGQDGTNDDLAGGSEPRLENGAGDASVEVAASLREAVRRIDPTAEFSQSGATFRVNMVPITLIYDINVDRMRLLAPVRPLDEIEPEIMIRMMQANFESALDARYAVAQGIVWSTFVHPLSSLTPDEFGSGLGQTVNLVTTFGSAYTSGAIIFGGGDGVTQERELIDELQEKSSDI